MFPARRHRYARVQDAASWRLGGRPPLPRASSDGPGAHDRSRGEEGAEGLLRHRPRRGPPRLEGLQEDAEDQRQDLPRLGLLEGRGAAAGGLPVGRGRRPGGRARQERDHSDPDDLGSAAVGDRQRQPGSPAAQGQGREGLEVVPEDRGEPLQEARRLLEGQPRPPRRSRSPPGRSGTSRTSPSTSRSPEPSIRRSRRRRPPSRTRSSSSPPTRRSGRPTSTAR